MIPDKDQKATQGGPRKTPDRRGRQKPKLLCLEDWNKGRDGGTIGVIPSLQRIFLSIPKSIIFPWTVTCLPTLKMVSG